MKNILFKGCIGGMGEYKKIYSRITGINMVEDSEKMWMTLLNRNGICEINKATGYARICKTFAEETLDKEWLYCCVEKVGNQLIFSPGTAGNIAIYDLEDDLISYIPLKNKECNYKENQDGAKFWNTFRHRTSVYLLGYSYPAIVKIDMKSKEVIYITDWVKQVEENIEMGDDNGYFGDGYVIIDDLALVSVGCMNAVLEINLTTDCTKLRMLDVPMKGIGGIASEDGENIWLVGKGNITNRVCRWNMRTGEIGEYLLTDEDEHTVDPFFAPVCIGSMIFLLPISASAIYEFDVNVGKLQKSPLSERLSNDTGNSLWSGWKTMAPRRQGNRLFFLTCNDLAWHEYNTETGEVINFYIHYEESTEEAERYFDTVYSNWKKECFFSEVKLPLSYYANQITKPNGRNIKEKSSSGYVGEKIYGRVCKNI